MPTFNQFAQLSLSSALKAVAIGKPIAQSTAAAPVQPAQVAAASSPPAASPVSVPGIGATVLGSSSIRPLWFDGRFLAASDMRREQSYFLHRQAIYGRAAGSGVLNGLTVEQAAAGSQFDTAETIVIGAGVGLTPSGQLVMISTDLTIELSDLADEQNLDEQFGLAETPQQPPRTRTGVYIVALRPVQFTANPIASYPSSLTAPRVAQDGDIVEATAVSLVPFANPVNNYDSAMQRAALARQIFVAGNGPTLPASMLPLAMIGLDRNTIQWIDMYLVRRDSGPQSSSLQLGLAGPAEQQAFLLQYDAQLQAVATSLAPASLNFAATAYFQALPAAGRFPFAAIDAVHLLQQFFPQQLPVQLSLIPVDELPAVIEDSMSLPPLDLTMAASSFANFSVCALVPVDRAVYNSQSAALPPTALSPALPQVAPVLPPVRSLLLLRSVVTPPPTTTTQAPGGWQTAIGGMTYGFYVLRRSEPIYVALTDSTSPATTTTPAPAPSPTTVPLPTLTIGPIKPIVPVDPILTAAPTTASAAPVTSAPTTAPPIAVPISPIVVSPVLVDTQVIAAATTLSGALVTSAPTTAPPIAVPISPIVASPVLADTQVIAAATTTAAPTVPIKPVAAVDPIAVSSLAVEAPAPTTTPAPRTSTS